MFHILYKMFSQVAQCQTFRADLEDIMKLHVIMASSFNRLKHSLPFAGTYNETQVEMIPCLKYLGCSFKR